MSSSCISIAINKKVDPAILFEFYKFKKTTGNIKIEASEFFFFPTNSANNIGDGYAQLFREDIEEFTISFGKNRQELTDDIINRFTEGSFWALCYSGEFGVHFLNSFLSNLYSKFNNEDCIILDDFSNDFKLKEFCQIWNKR